MSTSTLSWIEKIKEGMIFHEGFEDRDFYARSGWEMIQGVARNSTDQALQGNRSLKMGGSTESVSGYPLVLKKNLPDFEVSDDLSHFQIITAWFYDDLTVDTNFPGPFLKVHFGVSGSFAGGFFQVGVRNSITPSKYVCNPNFNKNEYAFVDSGKTRVAGWHKFQIRHTVNTSQLRIRIFIDNELVSNYTMGSGEFPAADAIYLQADVTSNPADSFGYFDEVRYQRSLSPIHGVAGRRIILREYDTDLLIGISDQPLSLDTTYLGFPVDPEFKKYYLEISQRISSDSDTTNYSKTQFVSAWNKWVEGDELSFKEIDFGRKLTAFNDSQQNLLTQGILPGGQRETIVTGLRDKITVLVEDLEGRDSFTALNTFYEHARSGAPFTLVVESQESTMAHVALPSESSALQIVVATPYVPASGLFKVGQYYVLENRSHTKRQIVKVMEVQDDTPPLQSQGTLTIEGRLEFGIFAGDSLRSLFVWPCVQLDNPEESGLDLVDARYVRYHWRETFLEYVQP